MACGADDPVMCHQRDAHLRHDSRVGRGHKSRETRYLPGLRMRACGDARRRAMARSLLGAGSRATHLRTERGRVGRVDDDIRELNLDVYDTKAGWWNPDHGELDIPEDW